MADRPLNLLMYRAALTGVAATLVLAPLACRAAETPDEATSSATSSAASLAAGSTTLVQKQATRRSGQVETSRSNAIVEAATEVAPAVVSVNVLRTEQVQTRSFFDHSRCREPAAAGV